ncbi:DNA primase large subunit isoform X2 [Phyllopteryx taeniolatus]|uniref:DNA primase large subunit isoform X2 n=1 Tax=Phyllopteryx taeniolatus TaxID=161469 RepID=UPI002AD3DDCC|nr:DNA primase large subunit isoform X2 [Phyllopteryx taeniolatus]
MEFSSRRRKFATSHQKQLYGLPLQFYGQPPLENISLTEFETFAVERLKLLKTVENLGVSYVKLSEQYIKKLDFEFRNLNFPYRVEADDRKTQSGPSEYEKRRKDHISHFILRLAYCQTEDLRRWFIQQEVDLLRYRFNELHPKLKLEFLHKNNLKYDAIPIEEKRALQDKLVNSSYGVSGITVEDQEFYKLTARSLPAVQSDERLQPLLNHLSHSYLGQDYSIQKNVGKISLEQIDSLSGKSFPLCMRQLHQSLRENHHLRHGGRMQYGLFLKGIGLSLEQALQFWRSEFIRGKVDADKFDKAYAYSIRHMFGKEGKRTDYTPYSCMKVIMSNPPSQGDHHGCPFRHSDPELLKQKLQFYKVSPSGVSQILDLVKGMHYQLACQKYFELTHNVEDANFSLNHPNQYFVESQKILGGGKDVKREMMDTPQRSQVKSAFKNSSGSREKVVANTNPSQDLAKMTEDLDSYFQDA